MTLKAPDDPVPTTAVKTVEDSTLNEAACVPPRTTAVVPLRFAPVTVIVAPVPAVVGVTELILGDNGDVYVNPGNPAVPADVVTLSVPEEPDATVAITVVELID